MVCKVATVKLAGACLALAEVPGLTFRISHVNMHGARFTFLVPHWDGSPQHDYRVVTLLVIVWLIVLLVQKDNASGNTSRATSNSSNWEDRGCEGIWNNIEYMVKKLFAQILCFPRSMVRRQQCLDALVHLMKKWPSGLRSTSFWFWEETEGQCVMTLKDSCPMHVFGLQFGWIT